MSRELLLNLNSEQKEAVLYNGGPLFVVAGAGTGKTRTLTHKVAYLICQGLKPEEILVLTFTNRAANEMSQRVDYLLEERLNFPFMATFHAFALKFLKMHIEILESRYNANFSIADEYDSKKIIKDIIDEKNLVTVLSTKDIYKEISNYKTGFKEQSKYIEQIYPLYQERLEKNNLLDFDDLLLYTIKILEEYPEIRVKYYEQFKYILVDEFQDTDKNQYKILTLLADKNKNIFAVGDPDQSIYSFRGAVYENNQSFISDFNAKVINLNKNYRSVNNILKSANKLIKYNESRENIKYLLAKNLVSNYELGSPVSFNQYKSDIDEAEKIASAINYLISTQGVMPSQIAILLRANYLSRIFEQAFINARIPYIIYGGLEFYKRKEIKDFLAYIKVILNPHQDYYLERIINFPKRGIGNKLLKELDMFSKTKRISLYDAIKAFPGKGRDKLLKFADEIKEMQDKFSEAKDLGEIIDIIGETTGYYNELVQKEMELQAQSPALAQLNSQVSLKAIPVYNNLDQLKTVITTQASTINSDNNIDKMREILENLELLTDNESPLSDDQDKVIISTYHQVKGLEFDTVFMPAMEEDIIPNAIIKQSNIIAEMEEERRIAYVGITRAKKRLFISYTQKRFRFGSSKEYPPSRFISEMQPEKVDLKDNNNLVGASVFHQTFKDGVIIKASNNIITILFKDGEKKISKDFPGLQIFVKE